MDYIQLILEYDGTNYAGWQSQKNGVAVQDLVARAIEKMVEEKITLRGASRTDAGVHALGQAAVFKTARKIPCDGFLRGLNTLLPEDIRIVACKEVAADFHPIRSAKRKHYDYLLETGEVPSALWRRRAWWVGPKLDRSAMKEAAQFLIGEHDFKSFRGALSKTKTTVRCLDAIDFAEENKFLRIKFSGNGFLKYMIRNIVGTFVEIGLGKLGAQDLPPILEAKDRRRAGPTAPPHGLYLVEIEY